MRQQSRTIEFKKKKKWTLIDEHLLEGVKSFAPFPLPFFFYLGESF